MSRSKKTFWVETLADPLPRNPLEVAAQWLSEARLDAKQPNPDAMVLATVDGRGYPSARVVLCKGIIPQPGSILFHSNYRSRKGSELEGNPRAAVVFHWDHSHRQVRAEGRVERLSKDDSDGRAGSAPGPASTANRSSRARRWLPRFYVKRGALEFPTQVPVRRSPKPSPWMCRARPIGAAIGYWLMPSNSGWRANFAYMTARAGLGNCLSRGAAMAAHPGR
jgi:pyridoxamine 5'-phosphate oxidase